MPIDQDKAVHVPLDELVVEATNEVYEAIGRGLYRSNDQVERVQSVLRNLVDSVVSPPEQVETKVQGDDDGNSSE